MTTPINPKLPANFDNLRNEDRPSSQRKWWGRPYITTQSCRYTLDEENTWRRGIGIPEQSAEHFEKQLSSWLAAWPTGTRYDVRCLDGGAWDRSTWKGSFATLEEAFRCARDTAAAGTYGPWPGRDAA